ncbi:MAG: protein kinase [Planctomycetes bacterium]|nr:protein kinase [Planctomycetota bacterium]
MNIAPFKTEIVTLSPSDLVSDSSQASKHLQGIRLRKPNSSSKKSSVLDEAYDEFCRLREAGDAVDPDEFCARYSKVQSSLARLIEAHRFLEDNSHLLGDSVPEAWPQSGEEFAGFSLLGELGQGAFARVFQAKEPALGNRLVALKISPEASNEAAILGRINHPHIVPVYSVREEPITGLAAVCMPYLGSATLSHVLDRVRAEGVRLPAARASIILEAIREPGSESAPTPVAVAPAGVPPVANVYRRSTYVDGIRWIATRLAEALAFIHEKGICHRDLKPSNVLMKPDGTPMLLDFNLSSDETLTETKIGGTPLYMAPEQMRGLDKKQKQNPPKPDGRSDLFSLGVILYEVLTGKHPFGPIPLKLSSAEMRKHLGERQTHGFRPIRELNPAVDKTFARAIERCLALDVAARPQTAARFVKMLKRSNTPAQRVVRALVRHPRTVAATSLLLMTVAGAGAYQVATAPPKEESQYNLAKEAYDNAHYKQAVYHLDEALKADPNKALAYWLRARAYQQMGEYNRQSFDRAIDDFQRYGRLAPNGPGPANAEIGYCHLRLDRDDYALLFFDDAKKSGFSSPEMANDAGLLESKKKSDVGYANATKWFEEALRQEPNSTVVHYNFAKLIRRKVLLVQQRKDRESQLALAEKGLLHLRKAMESGPVSMVMALDAARFCALAAEARPKEPQWGDAAVTYLYSAMKLGLNPAELRIEASGVFRAIKDKPQFVDICNSQQAVLAVEMKRYVDPVSR